MVVLRCDEDESVVCADLGGPGLGVLARVLARRWWNGFVHVWQWEVDEIDQFIVRAGAASRFVQNPVGDCLAVTARTSAADDYCDLEIVHERPFNIGYFTCRLKQAVSAGTRPRSAQVKLAPPSTTIVWPLT